MGWLQHTGVRLDQEDLHPSLLELLQCGERIAAPAAVPFALALKVTFSPTGQGWSACGSLRGKQALDVQRGAQRRRPAGTRNMRIGRKWVWRTGRMSVRTRHTAHVFVAHVLSSIRATLVHKRDWALPGSL